MTSQKFTNSAAWLTKCRAPLEVRAAPYTPPLANEIVVRNRALAMNPVDNIVPALADAVPMAPHVKPPYIIGIDCAGHVVEVGSSITRFKVGDRVIGHATSFEKDSPTSSKGSFQLYTVLFEHMTSPIPDEMSFETAAVIPLGFSTAAAALFRKETLGLPLPSLHPKPSGKTILIWGGSTSVGCNTIQLAVAAGYEVITTCSPRNFNLVKGLGASQAFDYNSKTVIQDIIDAFANKTCAGGIAIGQGSASLCLDILGSVKGNKTLAMASLPLPKELPTQRILLNVMTTMVPGMASLMWKSTTRGIKISAILAGTLAFSELGPAMYQDYLPKALEQKKFKPAPAAYVFGHGLESIQGACDYLKKGVSAKKIVVTL